MMLLTRRSLLTGLALAPLAAAFPVVSARAAAMQGLPSFHAFPSSPQFCQPYDRSVPLLCDTLEFDTTPRLTDGGGGGSFDLAQHCFVAPYPCIAQFHVNLLWQRPIATAGLTALVFYGVLPPAGGAANGEVAGDDVTIGSTTANYSTRVTRQLQLNYGDKVWGVPCANTGTWLTNARGGESGYNQVNYFEGIILSRLG